MTAVSRSIRIHPLIVFLVLLLLVAPAALLQGNNLLIWLLAVMLVGPLLTLAWTRLTLAAVDVRRLDPGHARVGVPMHVGYAATNRSRWRAAFSLWIDEEPGSWQSHLRPARGWIMECGGGETVHTEAIFWPTRRGEVRFDVVRVATTFPFGMLRATSMRPQSGRVLVQPAVHELHAGVLQAIIAEGPMGQRSQRRGRGGDEYYGIREQRTGDGLRDIAWKASARRSELICIERSRPSPPRVRVVLDLSTPTAQLKGEGDDLHTLRAVEESAISLAASVLAEALRSGHEFGLHILGVAAAPDPGLRGGPRHLDRLLTQLATIDLDAARSGGQIAWHRHQGGLVVISPDRVRARGVPVDALCLSGRQLPTLCRGMTREAVA